MKLTVHLKCPQELKIVNKFCCVLSELQHHLEVTSTHQLTCLKICFAKMCLLCVHFSGDPILSGVEWQSEKSSLYLYPRATEFRHHRDQLQTVCTAGGRRGADLSAQQHTGGGKLVEFHMQTAKLTHRPYV